jgi:pyruvate ferredoxin oxidoreductase gamma subunit
LAELGLEELADRLTPEHMVAVPATEIAREHLGRPLPNAALLGGFAALTGQVSLAAVARAIRGRFPGAVGEGNVRAAEVAHDHVAASMRRSADA